MQIKGQALSDAAVRLRWTGCKGQERQNRDRLAIAHLTWHCRRDFKGVSKAKGLNMLAMRSKMVERLAQSEILMKQRDARDARLH